MLFSFIVSFLTQHWFICLFIAVLLNMMQFEKTGYNKVLVLSQCLLLKLSYSIMLKTNFKKVIHPYHQKYSPMCTHERNNYWCMIYFNLLQENKPWLNCFQTLKCAVRIQSDHISCAGCLVLNKRCYLRPLTPYFCSSEQKWAVNPAGNNRLRMTGRRLVV